MNKDKNLEQLMREMFYEEESKKNPPKKEVVIPKPKEIKEYLDRFVVGQDYAKKAISTLYVNHMVRAEYNKSAKKGTDRLTKSNVLLIGDSGVGKTHIIKVASEFVDIPVVIEDATKLTQEGYVGDSVDTILTRLYTHAGNDLEKAQRGIVFLDEFDKLGEEGSRSNVSTTAVQQSLLTMVEGAKLFIPAKLGDKHNSEKIEIDTSSITFIFAGAFGGLGTKVKAPKSLGFLDATREREILESDIIKYGIMPEILGRIGTYITLDELTEEEMYKILTEVDNSLISRYKKLFELRGLEWTLTDVQYKEIIAQVRGSKLGARGLLRQVEQLLLPAMYEG